jgi:hypothetical protein
MNRRQLTIRHLLGAILLAVSCDSLLADNSGQSDSALAFQLEAVDGGLVEVRENGCTRFTVVCFLGVECPLARSSFRSRQKCSVSRSKTQLSRLAFRKPAMLAVA